MKPRLKRRHGIWWCCTYKEMPDGWTAVVRQGIGYHWSDAYAAWKEMK